MRIFEPLLGRIFGKGSLLRNEPQYPTKGYAPHSGRGGNHDQGRQRGDEGVGEGDLGLANFVRIHTRFHTVFHTAFQTHALEITLPSHAPHRGGPLPTVSAHARRHRTPLHRGAHTGNTHGPPKVPSKVHRRARSRRPWGTPRQAVRHVPRREFSSDTGMAMCRPPHGFLTLNFP